MQAFSKNNHLNYGYTEEFKQDSPNSVFHLGIGQLEHPPESFFAECKSAALDIYKKSNGKKIYVALSAGADSECVFRSFVAAEVPFEVCILKFDSDLNNHEVNPAIQLCESFNITYNIFSLDIFKFLESGVTLEYAKKFKLSSPMIATHLWLAEKVLTELKGIPIFSGDFVRLAMPSNEDLRHSSRKPLEVGPWVLPPAYWSFGSLGNQDHFALDLLFKSYQQFGVANFFLYSVEQIAASMTLGLTPGFRKFENEISIQSREVIYKTPDVFYKNQILLNKNKEHFFSLAGFQINTRSSKWTGFELIHQLIGRGCSIEELSLSKFFEESINGMTLFNEKYRQPMQALARQVFLKKILLHPTLFKYMSAILYPKI